LGLTVTLAPLKFSYLYTYLLIRKRVDAAGKGQASELTQLSSLYVEAVEKKPGAAKTKHFHGDASKVVASGNGLKKGFPGRPCTFNLEAKDAGGCAYQSTDLCSSI